MIAVELSLKQLKDAVRKLSPTEKLEINEMIWSDDTVIPIEHQNLVNDRIKKATDNPQSLLDWQAAAKTLRS